MKKAVLMILIIIWMQQTHAASAVAYCKETGNYGYSYDCMTLQEAIDSAKQECRDGGGRSPEIICSSTGAGFGAIAYNDSTWRIYATVSYADAEEAMATAYRNCPGGEVVVLWYDCGGKANPSDTDLGNYNFVSELMLAHECFGGSLYP